MGVPAKKPAVAKSFDDRLKDILLNNPSFQRITTALAEPGLRHTYLPDWGVYGKEPVGYIEVYLPTELYNKWIWRLVSSDSFRKSVETRVEELAKVKELSDMMQVEILWSGHGPSFYVKPGNACGTHPESEHPNRYTCHNTDYKLQVDLLAACLVGFLDNLYPALEKLGQNPAAFPDILTSDEFLPNIQIELEGHVKMRKKMRDEGF